MLCKLRCFGKAPGCADCLKQVYNHGNSLADGADAILNALSSSPYTGERRAICSSEFSAEKVPVGSVRSLAANAHLVPYSESKEYTSNMRCSLSYDHSMLLKLRCFGNYIPNTPSKKRCPIWPFYESDSTHGRFK